MLLGLCIRSCEAVLAAVYNTGTVAVDCYHDAGLESDCEETADASETYSWGLPSGLGKQFLPSPFLFCQKFSGTWTGI